MYIPVCQSVPVTWHLLAVIMSLYRPSVLQSRNKNTINLRTGKNWHIQEYNQARLEWNILEYDFITTSYLLSLI